MKRIVLTVVAAAVIVAAIVAFNLYTSRPTLLEGDPWDYNLTQADVPEGWERYDSQIETAYEAAQRGQATSPGLVSIHSAAFAHRTAVDVFDITSQVILYETLESAGTALSAEALDEEWERAAVPRTIGDQTIVWHFKFVEDAPKQSVYRVDSLYLNGIISITVTGTLDGMPGPDVALSYVDKVWNKMRRSAQPAALRVLASAGRPDLRGLLLSQADLAGLDPSFGDRWLYNSKLPLGWTPNADFENPERMVQLGRVMGYQVWLIKPLDEDELAPVASTGLFQQVAAYRSPEQAQETLTLMVGLRDGDWPAPPPVGESAKGWTQVYDSQGTSAGPGAVATTEISFRVGSYIGSIRLQGSPVTAGEVEMAIRASQEAATRLADGLAEKLRKVGN
jgi:hypothetical protein